jgi:hypothetical protein
VLSSIDLEFRQDFWVPSTLKSELNPFEYQKKLEESELATVAEHSAKNHRRCKRSKTFSGKSKRDSVRRLVRRNTVIGNETSPVMIDPSTFKKTESQDTLSWKSEEPLSTSETIVESLVETFSEMPLPSIPVEIPKKTQSKWSIKRMWIFGLFKKGKKSPTRDMLPGKYSPEPNMIEKRLYVSSHTKLMEGSRPLAQQVLISNLMIKILSTHAHLNTPLPKIEPKKPSKPRRRHSLQHHKPSRMKPIKAGRRTSEPWKFNIVDHFLSEEDDHVPLYQLKTNISA